jgi:uncharacterized membrane-anchored protein
VPGRLRELAKRKTFSVAWQIANFKSRGKIKSENYFPNRQSVGIEIANAITGNQKCFSQVSESYIKENRIMTAKAKIKVIKKGEAKEVVEAPIKVEIKKNQAAREMVSTVTNWVSEFQQRRRDETKQAIEKFFTNQPQTNGV